MSTSSDHLDELRSLVGTITADRQAQKDKEKREAWTKFVSLSTIILAVLAAIATQKGAGFSSASIKQLNEATFAQAQASDGWAYYQAKGIKGSIYQQELELLSATASADPKRLADIKKTVDRYKSEQEQIAKEAREHEAKRDVARREAAHAGDCSRGMGLSTTIFQIAIALGGITLIVKKRALWSASLLCGAAATAQMVYVLWWL
jgi:hypothetical protein